MRGPVPLAAALVLVVVLVLSSGSAALAQIAPVSRNAVNLTVSPVAGTTAFGAHFSYRLNTDWDLLVGYDTAGGTGLLSLGGRYYMPSRTADINPYLIAELLSAATTGFLVGVGASTPLATSWTGFGTIGLASGPGGSVFAYDVGVQYRTSQQMSLVIGASNLFSSGALYFGVSLGLGGR